jgi:hypothetical protein
MKDLLNEYCLKVGLDRNSKEFHSRRSDLVFKRSSLMRILFAASQQPTKTEKYRELAAAFGLSRVTVWYSINRNKELCTLYREYKLKYRDIKRMIRK